MKKLYLIFQHMKQGGFAGIIEAQKQDLSLLLPQSQRGQYSVEPIQQKHLRILVIIIHLKIPQLITPNFPNPPPIPTKINLTSRIDGRQEKRESKKGEFRGWEKIGLNLLCADLERERKSKRWVGVDGYRYLQREPRVITVHQRTEDAELWYQTVACWVSESTCYRT